MIEEAASELLFVAPHDVILIMNEGGRDYKTANYSKINHGDTQMRV